MPILKVNNINSYSGNTLNLGASTDAITLTATSLTVPSTASISLPNNSLSYANIANAVNFRNRIINGDMRIDQRNAGASQTITAAAALAYTVDRWYAYSTGANVTGQRVAGSLSQYQYQFTGAASVTAIGFGQRIEATNCYDLANKTATLSVNLSNSLLTTVTWTAYYANSTDTFGTLASPSVTQIATGTFTVTSTLTNYSTNISIPSAATTGIQIVFTVGAQTSGTWVIGNVQLEAGSNASGFELLPYDVELARCYRYFYLSNPSNFGAASGWGTSFPTNNASLYYTWPVTMRTSPTVTRGGSSDTFFAPSVTATATATTSYTYISVNNFWWVVGSVSTSLSLGYAFLYNGQLSVLAEL